MHEDHTPPPDRHLSGWDLFLLWAGAGIALTEIWAGGLVVKLGWSLGLLVIVIGHVIGNTVMAAAGHIGARQGIAAIVSTRPALGSRAAFLPALLNVIQMIGWTGFMIWVGGKTMMSLPSFAGFGERNWMLVIGAATTLWALLGQRGWRIAQRIGVLMLVLLAGMMTWKVFDTHTWSSLSTHARDPSFPIGVGLDLVIAMPISWLPLVSDYTRYAREAGRGTRGTWLGYFIGSTWMYIIGLAVALATTSSSPDAMVIRLLADSGWLGVAVGLIVISTLTTTFLNIFSNAISARILLPRCPERVLIAIGGLAGTLLSIQVDGMTYEPFLLYIGAAFCPLFGIVLTDYYLVRQRRIDAALYQPAGNPGAQHAFQIPALAIWLFGFAVYQSAAKLGWPTGSAIPSLIATSLAYWIVMRLTQPRKTS